jgi:hypothetical protein
MVDVFGLVPTYVVALMVVLMGVDVDATRSLVYHHGLLPLDERSQLAHELWPAFDRGEHTSSQLISRENPVRVVRGSIGALAQPQS